MTAIEVVLGDITAQHVDAIVNAANRSRSVAFPAISAGVYGFPPGASGRDRRAHHQSAATTAGQVRLVAFDLQTRDLLEAALSR